MLIDDKSHMLPIYPLIAQQIVDDYGIVEGKCLDIGTGPGYLGVELAKITNLEMYFVDMDSEVLKKCETNVVGGYVDNVCHFVGTDVCNLLFEDDFADLVVSRGSLWFWADQAKGLQEIYRVLKPGGVAFVGGGLGRYTPPSMRARLKGKRRRAALRAKEGARFLEGGELEDLLMQVGLTECRVVSDVESEGGTWLEMKKPCGFGRAAADE